MKSILVLMCFIFFTACNSTVKESRLQSAESLEKPPEAPVKEQTEKKQDTTNKITGDEKPRRKGLGSDVYLVNESNNELKIKRDFDEAWILFGQAIRLNNLKVIEKKDEGIYRVSFKSGGVFDGFDIFGSNSAKEYACKVEALGEKTKVTITLADGNEALDSASLKDGVPDYSYDGSSKLLELIYETLLNGG